MKVLSLTPQIQNPSTHNFHQEIPLHFIHQSEIFVNLKTFFRFSKIFSGLPVLTFGGDNGTFILPVPILSLSMLFTLILCVNNLILLGFAIGRGDDFVKQSGPEIVLKSHVVLIYLINFIVSSKFICTLRESPLVEKRLQIYTESKDILRLRRFAWVLFILYGLFGLGLTLIPIVDSVINQGWSNYGQQACGFGPNLLFHFTLTNIYCLISNVVINYTWIFGDFFLTLLSIVLTSFYTRLVRSVRGIDPARFSLYEIDLVREHFGILSKLVVEFDNSIAALNLVSYIFNISYLTLSGYSMILKSSMRRVKNDDLLTRLVFIVAGGVKLTGGIVTSSLLHYKAREAVVYIRSWSMTRGSPEYSMNHLKIWIIQSFILQLSTSAKIGFSIGKLMKIKFKMVVYTFVGICAFFIFARITTSTCSRKW